MILAEQIKAAFATFEMQINGFAKDAYRKDIRIAKLTDALAYAIKEADGWHDECRGAPVQSAAMEHARSLLVDTKMAPPDCDENSARIAELEAERVQWRERVVSLEGTLFGTLELLENTDGLSKNNIENLAGEKATEIRKALLLPVAKLAEASAPAVEQQKPEHVAYAENGVLYWMTGRKFQNCELYTAPQAADTDKVREALHEAVAAIYFDDNSKYEGALWNIVRHLSPSIIELLQSDPRAAYCAVSERKCPCGFDKSGCDHYNREGDCTHNPAATMAAQAPVREVPGWISIKDQLPDDKQLVWCTRYDGRVHLARRHGNKPLATGEPSYNCYWWDEETGNNWSDVTVSAWMPVAERIRPLPAAPVQQEGEKPSIK